MKRKISSLLLLALTAMASRAAADIPADTVAIIEKPSQVTVTDDGTTTSIRVTGTAKRPDYNFLYTVSRADTARDPLADIKLPFVSDGPDQGNRSSVVLISGIYAGAVIPYHGPQAVRTSVEGGVRQLIGYRYTFGRAGAALGFGAGFGTKIFNIRRGMTASKDADMLTLTTAPDGASHVRTELRMWSLHVPFYYQQRIYRSLAFELSVTANLNVSARAKSKYDIADIEYTQKVSGLHQRMLTPDFMLAIGSADFGAVYVKWSPVSAFKRCYGPDLKTLSVGVCLPF